MDPMVRELAKDAITFIRTFAVPIWSTAPHIYLSALALTHSKSKIHEHYAVKFPNLLQCSSNIQAMPLQGVIHAGVSVMSVDMSPDQKRIVSGLQNGTVVMWDAETLHQIGQPLTGHSDDVTCVAFSPNGKQIISGSEDGTIRVWDAETLQQIGQPLTGHRYGVTCVAFSPNGKQIVSGSSDKTIHVWDAETLQQIGQPLTGHIDIVTCIAFSPNGKQIASGGNDRKICIWDGESLHKFCVNPLKIGHSLFSRHGYLLPLYKISDDHWVLGINGDPLFWIPPNIFDLFPHHYLLGILNSSAIHKFDDSHFVYGEQWEKFVFNPL